MVCRGRCNGDKGYWYHDRAGTVFAAENELGKLDDPAHGYDQEGMTMPYTPTTWVPGGPPGISAARLNNIEQGIVDAHTSVDSHAAATDGVHGATRSLVPNTIVMRDANSRINVADPSSASHAATKNYVDAVASSKIDKSGGVSLGNFTIDSGALRFTDSGFTRNVLSTWGGDGSGIGIHLGGAGGGIAIGAGESGGLIVANNNPTSEHLYLGADQNVYLYSNMQNGWDVRKEAIWRNDGVLMLDGKRAMTRGDDPTGLIIPLLMPSTYYYTSNTDVNNTSVLDSSGGALADLKDYKMLLNTAHFRGRTAYFEVIMASKYAGIRANARLARADTGYITELFTFSTTPVRLRSAAITLQDGDELFVKLYTFAGTDPEVRLYAARIILL